MRSRDLLNGQVCPDGVFLYPNWNKLEVGMSLFIPAINLTKLNKQVERIANTRCWTLLGAERIENGKLGMRFWRIL